MTYVSVRTPRPSVTKRVAPLLASLALLSACGTRLPEEAFTAADEGPAVAASEGGATSARATGSGAGAGAGSGEAVPGASSSDSTGAAAAGSDPAAGGEAGAGPAPGAAGPNQASDVGVTETTIRIGTIVAENGVLGDVFAAAVTGLRSWVEHVNSQGGINGRTIELFTCDDREDRARALECARRLVEQDGVFALLATNTRAMGGAAPYLHEQGIPVLGFPINNSFYRYPNFFTIYGAPYVRDGSAVGDGGRLAWYSTMYRWLRESTGATKAAVFSYDVAESAQAGDSYQDGLEAEGFQVTRYVVSFAAPSFDAAVADMQRQGIEIVFDSMDTGANVRLCDAMARRNYRPRAKVSPTPIMGASFGEDFPDACRNVTYVATDSVPFTDASIPFVAAYRDGMARYQRGRELHQWGLEAWLIGQLFQDALVAMGPAPTRQGFVDHLLSLRKSDVGGLMTPTIQWQPGDFSAATVRDCIGIAKWDDAAGGWTNAAPFPYCVDDAKQYFSGIAENGD